MTEGAIRETDAEEGAAGRGRGVTRFRGARRAVRELYLGFSPRAVRFRYGLLLFDLAVIAFVVVSSFHRGSGWIVVVDIGLGVLLLLDFAARMWVSPRPLHDLLHPTGLADIIVLISLLAPALGTSFAFLRVARALRLFRSYQLIARLRQDFAFFRRNQDVVFSTVNLLVFILVMTALVFESQIGRNPSITNYADALYFTVTTLTTTGFGDVILQGTAGRLLAVLIMIFGVSLFIRLAQTVFRPSKVTYECPECGLSRHDLDAVHCKHCGKVLHITTEGLT